jgi:hypothetical protein
MAQELIDLADLVNRLRQYGLSNNIPQEGTPEDPANWENIQASLQGVGSSPDQLAMLQQAAQNAIMSGGGYMPQTVDPALAASDPNAANALLRQNVVNQLMQMLQGQQGAYDAASAEVGQQYQQLTNPINAEGTGFLQELYQNLGINPATDPTAQQFMNTLSSGQNTAQLNQATDQAWFDKMKTNNMITSQGLIQGIADGSIPIPGLIEPIEEDTGGGGGGGGGGRRGGRGYGGRGGSGGDWTDPKTTDALTEAAAVDSAYQFPGFMDAFIGVGKTPEEQETLARIAGTYGGFPYNVNKGLSGTELPNAEAAIDALTAQHAQRAAYMRVLGGGGREAQYANEFSELGNRSKASVENPTDVANPPLNTGEQARLRRLAEMALSQGLGKAFNQFSQQSPSAAPYDKNHALRTMYQRVADMFEGTSRYGAQELDREALELAQSNPTDANPTGKGKDFSFKDWTGYTPNIDRSDFSDKWSHLDLLRRATPVAREFDPNYGWQDTKYTQKDSSSAKTTQSSKAPQDQLFDNNTDPGYVPYSQTEEEAAAMGGFGMGIGRAGNRPGLNLTKAAQRIVADRAKRQAAIAAQQEAEATPAENVAEAVQRVLPSWNKKVAKPAAKKAAPAPKPKPTTAVAAIENLGANLFGPKKQPKKSTSLSKTVKAQTKKKVNKTVKGFF